MHNPELKSESVDEVFMQKTISVILEKMTESEFNGDALASELNISRMGLHRAEYISNVIPDFGIILYNQYPFFITLRKII